MYYCYEGQVERREIYGAGPVRVVEAEGGTADFQLVWGGVDDEVKKAHCHSRVVASHMVDVALCHGCGYGRAGLTSMRNRRRERLERDLFSFRPPTTVLRTVRER